jgi:large subunit ribosomal protein L4
MEIPIIDTKSGSPSGTLTVSDSLFGAEYNESLIHQVVTAYLSNARAGTKSQKSRRQVSGGGAKPWRQKGNGRARVGSSRSPIWRKGGVTFAAIPRDYTQKTNRKMYKGAIRSILSELIRTNRLAVVDSILIDSHKTKSLISKLSIFGDDTVLIITEDMDRNLYLASRNIPNVNVSDVAALDPVNLIKHEKVLLTRSALEQIERRVV